MDVTSLFSSPATASKKRPTQKSAAGRLINSSTTGNTAQRPKPSSYSNSRTYSPGQHLLDFVISDDESIHEDASLDEGFDASSLTSFGTPNPSGVENASSTSTPLSRSHHNFRPSNNITQLLGMLQQQQATLIQHGEMLQEALQNQRAQSTKLAEFEKKLASVEEKAEAAEADSKKLPKRKVKVTRDVSKKVYMIHDALECKFKVDESASTSYNKKVAEKIISEVTSQPDSTFSLASVKCSVKRCFENKRRIFRESNKENGSELLNKSRKYRSRRQRKYDNRSQVVTEKEKKYWEQLSVVCMTEESDDPDDPAQLIVHKLPWRSPKLNDWMELLDKRYKGKQKTDGAMFPRKTRVSGLVSESPPPVGLPGWALDPHWNSENGSTESTEGQHSQVNFEE